MRHFLMGACLAIIALQFGGNPAVACINDRDTPKTEQEFKRNYEFRSGYQEAEPDYVPQQPGEAPLTPLAATISGASLLAFALVLVTINVRRDGVKKV